MVKEAFDAGLTGSSEDQGLERTLESLREDAEVAQVLLGLSAALAEVNAVHDTLDKAVRIVREVFGADRCFAATCDLSSGRFRVAAAHGYGEDELRALEETTESGFPLLQQALKERQPLFIEDALQSDLMSRRDVERRGFRAYVGIPLVRWGEDFGGLGLEFYEPRTFGPKEEALARGIVRQVGVALINARRFNLLRELRGVGLRIGSNLRLTDVIREVSHGASDLLSGSGALVYLIDSQHRSLVSAGGYGLMPETAGAVARLDITKPPWKMLLEHGTVHVADLGSTGEAPEGLSSAAAAVIPGPGTSPMGAVVTFFDRPFKLGAEEIEALQVLTAQTSTALENAQRFERQRRVARSLQEGLLTTEMPDTAGCRFGAVYEPASAESDIGGDYFDVLDLPNGKFALVVGDVSGKGAEAAAQTAMAKYMLRAFAIRNPGPSSVLFHLNNALCRGLGEDRFTTLVYAVFDPKTRRCQLALGGHPPPLVYRAATGRVEGVPLEGSILGVFEDQQFEQMTIAMDHGDVFLGYTDGLPEARNNVEMFGVERIEEALARHAHLPAELLARRIYEDAREFGAITDDTVVLVLACGDEDA